MEEPCSTDPVSSAHMVPKPALWMALIWLKQKLTSTFPIIADVWWTSLGRRDTGCTLSSAWGSPHSCPATHPMLSYQLPQRCPAIPWIGASLWLEGKQHHQRGTRQCPHPGLISKSGKTDSRNRHRKDKMDDLTNLETDMQTSAGRPREKNWQFSKKCYPSHFIQKTRKPNEQTVWKWGKEVCWNNGGCW